MSGKRGKKGEIKIEAGAGVNAKDWFEAEVEVEEVAENPPKAKKVVEPVEIVEPVETGMPDFSVLDGEVEVMTPEVRDKVVEEDKKWKEFALGAGDELAKVEVARMQIERLKTEGFSPTLQKALQTIDEREKEILSRLSSNEEAMGRAMFDKPLAKMGLLAELTRNDEVELSDNEVQQYILMGYTQGRLEKLSRDAEAQARKERESNLISWGWSTYRLKPDAPEKKSKPNKAYLSQLRPLVNAVVAQRRRREKEQNEKREPEEVSVTLERMKAMKAGSSKYTLLDVAQGAKIPPAMVVCSEIEEYETKKGRQYDADCFTVMVRHSRDKRLELVPIKAIKKKEVFERLNSGGHYLPGAVLWDHKFQVYGPTPEVTSDLRIVAAMCRAAKRQEELRRIPQKPKQQPKKEVEVEKVKTTEKGSKGKGKGKGKDKDKGKGTGTGTDTDTDRKVVKVVPGKTKGKIVWNPDKVEQVAL